MADGPPSIEHRCLEYHYTKLGRSIYIEQCIYTHGRLTPLAIEHRCLEYHYTKLGTSNGRTMHIYLWQIDPQSIKHRCLYIYTKLGTYNGRLTPQSIEHRCLEYHYTKLGRSTIYRTMHIYLWQINPYLQLSIDALNTAITKLGTSNGRCYMNTAHTPMADGPPVNQA